MEVKMGLRAPLLWMCLCVPGLWALPFQSALELDITPRITVFFNGLLGCRRFEGVAQNYSTLFLEDEAGVLYVGARGALFALHASDIAAPGNNLTIHWEASVGQKKQCLSKGRDNQTECFNHIRFLQRFNETHLYACGTHAFRPQCVYIDADRFAITSAFEDGKDKCPFGPATGFTGLFVDGEMYTASRYDFRSSPDIRRSFPLPIVKTEEAPTRWLLEANFVGSALLKESINSSIGDDDKIYFFFTEKSQEQTVSFSQTRVARVARVCKGDWGGQRTLQRKWTSFLKARLLCSIPDYEFHLNVLRSVFVVEDREPLSSVFYGVFGLEWRNVKTSAVCRYSIKDVHAAFQGPYMESQDSKWTEYKGKVPEPRPGSCITDELRAKGINSSLNLPDDVLNFARRHPLVSRNVRPLDDRPLLLKRSVSYTQIAVERVTSLDGQLYDILFVGTDDGWLHRAVDIQGRVHIIEELQLFQDPQPVDRIVISWTQRSVYVGSPTGVLQLPLSTCHRYTSCLECIFARDPLCGWNGTSCVVIASRKNRANLTQDILTGNRGCENVKENNTAAPRTRSVASGYDVLLQCEMPSNLASPHWTLNGRELQGYGVESGYRVGTDGLLLIGARPEQSGRYSCLSVENGLRVPVASYAVRVRPEAGGGATWGPEVPSSEQPLPPPPEPRTFRNMETMYISLVAILGGLCLVLTSVLLYVSFCTGAGGRRAKRAKQQQTGGERKRSSHLELKTISSRCNGRREEPDELGLGGGDGLLQIVPGEGQASPSKEPPLPEAPPLPAPPPLPSSEYANGISATLPSVLRKMNGNSYVLLRQADPETTSPLYYSFTEELNRILEKRKHSQLVTSQPDESSV